MKSLINEIWITAMYDRFESSYLIYLISRPVWKAVPVLCHYCEGGTMLWSSKSPVLRYNCASLKVKVRTNPTWLGQNSWMKYEITTQQNAPGKVGGSVAVRKVVLSALIPPTQLLSGVECCQNMYFVVVVVDLVSETHLVGGCWLSKLNNALMVLLWHWVTKAAGFCSTFWDTLVSSWLDLLKILYTKVKIKVGELNTRRILKILSFSSIWCILP